MEDRVLVQSSFSATIHAPIEIERKDRVKRIPLVLVAVVIDLVNANHEPFPGQSKTVTFTIPKGASHSRSH